MFRFEDYHDVCLATINDENLFRVFRREHTFVDMYEHVTEEQGDIYLSEIKKNMDIYNNIPLFAKNDLIGNPIMIYYKELGFKISPTTLRYIKVLVDLVELCGSLQGMDIVEIGGGYGGQCRIIHEMFDIKSYTLVDLPHVAKMAVRYLKEFGISLTPFAGPYDLFISNYAFTEIERRYQDIYIEKFIKTSKRGYITCNFYEWYETKSMLTFTEIINLMPGSEVRDEIPLTAKDNFIYTWNTDHR